MKLATLGGATLILGVALSIPGLIAAGALWIVMGLIARAYGSDWQRHSEGGRTPGGAWMAGGTLVFLLIGLPSLAIGIFEIGIDAADSGWRWLPIAIGGLATGVGVISGLGFAIGSGLEAVAEAGGVPEHPATITIRAARETGVFVNERPRLEFELTVTPEGMPAYEVTKKATVPFTALGSIRPGDGFKARVIGPEKPESMEIDWSSPIPGGNPPAAT